MRPDLIAEFDLSGRVAVITGAAAGIGRETALVFAGAGARVAIADVDEAGLAETARQLREAGAEPLVRRTDVSDRAQVEALAALALREGGRLDAWVNVAGIIVTRDIVDVREDEMERMLAVNLKGVYWGVAAAGRAMGAGGAIVNLSSSGADSAVPGLSLYSITKASVNMLTRTAARELGPKGIRVNAIAPGWVDTAMGARTFVDESGAQDPAKRAEGLVQRAAASPLGLTGTPRDIALAALYLVSDASRFMTGQVVRPNGGVAMV